VYLCGDDLDAPPEVVFYCPACAEREFGGDSAAAPPGTHGALFGGSSSRRSPISALCSLRKRAQSARKSSETNSPGSSGSGQGGHPRVARFSIHSHLGCGNCGKPRLWIRRRLGKRATRRLYDLSPLVGSPERGICGESSERARLLRVPPECLSPLAVRTAPAVQVKR
jgi:hypothetical protein